MLIDTHCHLDFDRFDTDREEVIARAIDAGVTRIIVPALNLENCQIVLDLAEKFSGVFAAVGIHPNSTSEWDDSWLNIIREFAKHNKVVAIGEIGLDYYWQDSPKEVQHLAFSAQLALAAELNLPVIIHNRESSEDVIRLLSDSPLNGRERPGVLHSFSASLDTAEAAVDMGFYIGFTGPVTYKKSDGLRNIASQVPIDRILVETDAPFLAPQQYRGKRNEPAYVIHTANQLATILGLELDEFAKISSRNAELLFGSKLAES